MNAVRRLKLNWFSWTLILQSSAQQITCAWILLALDRFDSLSVSFFLSFFRLSLSHLSLSLSLLLMLSCSCSLFCSLCLFLSISYLSLSLSLSTESLVQCRFPLTTRIVVTLAGTVCCQSRLSGGVLVSVGAARGVRSHLEGFACQAVVTRAAMGRRRARSVRVPTAFRNPLSF